MWYSDMLIHKSTDQLFWPGNCFKPIHCQSIVAIAPSHAQKCWYRTLISIASHIDGDDWQSFVLQLLYLRYGTDLIEVPDQHKGDCGIEAFSIDGCAFQCYAPESPNNLADIARKHIRKITCDLNKFMANKKGLSAIFGTTKIRRWVLVVPEHCSSDVVAHCQSKTGEIAKLIPPLPYVTLEFQVMTVDGHDFFAAQIATLTSAGGLLVEAADSSIAAETIQKFFSENNELIGTLEAKLAKLPMLQDEMDRAALRDELLSVYLLGENAIAYYDDRYPAIADRIRSLKQSRATALTMDSKLQKLTITGTREKFEAELVTSVPALGKQTAMKLSYAAIAEWLMVCPLTPKE
jgi:hypothetical protein